MKFRSPTDEPLHVALTTGHTCTISPEGDEIPQMFHREAISRGAIPGSITAPETAPVIAPKPQAKAETATDTDGLRRISQLTPSSAIGRSDLDTGPAVGVSARHG